MSNTNAHPVSRPRPGLPAGTGGLLVTAAALGAALIVALSAAGPSRTDSPTVDTTGYEKRLDGYFDSYLDSP